MDEGLEEVLKDFVNESREHLAGIETDLLAIEEGGSDIDEALVNKVFRAAHSIKGGSGFFGLDKVKELAHKAESVLDLIRSRKMAPNAEVTNILLAAFDKLREMINDTSASEGTDIADLVQSLVGLASSWMPPGKKEALRAQVRVDIPSGGAVTLFQTDLDQARAASRNLYAVDCDLIHDFERRGINPLALFGGDPDIVDIVDCAIDYEAVGTLDDPVGNRLPLRLVLSSELGPERIGERFGFIERQRFHPLFTADDAAVRPSVGITPAIADSLSSGSPSQLPSTDRGRPGDPAHTEPPEPAVAAKASSAAKTSSVAGVEDTLRIDVRLLETLMNLAGELVLSRNQLRAAVAGDNRALLSSADQRINQVTAELQDVIMQTRLQPIGNIFGKLPRVVRDLARSLGKEIDLDIRGKDVALDKTLIEGLSDPLTHMVRNAVDHGVEEAEERRRNGKKPVGSVRIEARHEAGMVVVEIADDGKGIDGERIASAAVRKGLLTEEKVRSLSPRDKQALIFLPGLSTAAKVTDVSGRGVGMDVVKTNVDRLGGQVEIVSELGRGSTFRVKLPLTLAIIPSLIVSVENERFAIPQANIEELLRLRPEEAKERLEVVGDTDVLLLRERVIPLVRFSDLLGTAATYLDSDSGRRELDRRQRIADRRSRRLTADQESGAEDSGRHDHERQRRMDRRASGGATLEIVIVSTGIMSYGLIVGAFHDTEEVVVKPLGRRFKRLREYSGATILGDGTVALILDLAGLALRTGLTSVSGSSRAAELSAREEARRLEDHQSLLLFNNGPGEPCALSLDLVQRIERVDPSRIERLGERRTTRYRGGSLPLVALSDASRVASLDGEKDLVVLVSTARGREVGLLGTMPVDVVEILSAIDQTTHRQKGLAGSAVIRDRTTLIVDFFELVDAAYPEWSTERKEVEAPSSTVPGTVAIEAEADASPLVLLVEDSDFFRSQLKRYLEEEGFSVLPAPDGEAAWELLLKNASAVRVVVTDIEMPRLNGLGLARRIRADERTSGLPIIAVTSLAGDEDVARGREAGIDEYQIKLDRDKLVESVRRSMNLA